MHSLQPFLPHFFYNYLPFIHLHFYYLEQSTALCPVTFLPLILPIISLSTPHFTYLHRGALLMVPERWQMLISDT